MEESSMENYGGTEGRNVRPGGVSVVIKDEDSVNNGPTIGRKLLARRQVKDNLGFGAATQRQKMGKRVTK